MSAKPLSMSNGSLDLERLLEMTLSLAAIKYLPEQVLYKGSSTFGFSHMDLERPWSQVYRGRFFV